MHTDSGNQYAEYFKLSFYSQGSPENVRGRQFIFRIVWPKKLQELKAFLLTHFEGALWIEGGNKNPEDVKDSLQPHI
jgi:hypothetical protein